MYFSPSNDIDVNDNDVDNNNDDYSGGGIDDNEIGRNGEERRNKKKLSLVGRAQFYAAPFEG